MLLPTSWKCWTIFCCICASIAVVNSAVLAQLARANQARVVARQTTQMQMAHARANAAAAAARTRAHALLGPGARLGLARHGGILGDAQRVTRGSGDFFNEENVPTLDQNTLNNDIEDGNNRATTESEQVVLDEQLGATMDQEAFDSRGNLLSNQGVETAMVQEPGANCGCKRRIVIIPEETGKDMHHSNCFTVLSDTPVEARMISDQNQDINMQGSLNEPKFDETPEVQRTVHENVAALTRASSSEIGETEGDTEFSSNQQEAELPLMDAGVIDSQDDEEVGAERFHHGHDLIHKKLHKNQQPTFQNAHQTPVNIHVTQNQHLLVSRSSSADRGEVEEHEDNERNQQPITHNDQVDATQHTENQAQNVEQVTTPADQTKQVIGPVSEDKTDISGTTSRPLLDAKTDAPSEQVGSIFSQSLNDEQVGMPLSTPSTSGKAIDENDEQVGAPLDDLVEKIEARLSERLGAERTHHIHEMLHKNLHRPQAAAHHAQVIAPVNVHVIQNQHAIVAPRMSAADQESKNTEPSSNNSTGVVAPTTGPSTPVDKPDSQNEHVGASTPNGQLDDEEKVGAPAPTEQSDDDDEPVGAFLQQNIHGGVFVPRPIVHHGFGLRPAGVIHHNQHSIFGFRSASGEEDGSAAVMEPSNNATIDVQPQTDRPSETATMSINNGGPRVPENAAQDNIHPSTTVASEAEDEDHPISTTSMPIEKPIPHNIEQTTDAKTDQAGAERTAHLIHKIHNKLHGPTQTRPQTIPVNIHVVQNQGAAMIPRESSDQEAVTAKLETTDAKNDKEVGGERTAHLIHKIHNKLHGPTQTRPQTIPVNIHVTQNQGAVIVPRESSGQEAVTAKVETTDAKNDVAVGVERTAHLIHKIHNKLHGPSQTRPQTIPININVVQNQGAVIPRESSGQEAVTTEMNEHPSVESNATRPDSEAPSSARHLNHGLFHHRHEHIHSTGTDLSGISSFLNNFSSGIASNVNVHQNQNANVSPQNPSSVTNVNVVQNQNAAVDSQRPTTFIPSTAAATNVDVFQNQNAAVAPQRPSTLIPLAAGGSTNVEVFQNQNAVVGPQRPTTFIPSSGGSTNVQVFQNQNAAVGQQTTSGFVPVSNFGGASTNLNQGIQSTNVVQDQKAVILPSTSHVGGLSVGTQGYYQGLPSIQKPFGHVSGHASIFQSQSATIGRNADSSQDMEDVDVPDLEVKKGNLIDGDDSNADSDEVLGTYLHPHDPYYDNDNPDKTKVIDLIEDKKRIITKMIDSIKEKHDKILDSLKPKLEVKKHKKYYPKPQYPEEPLYHQYPSYAHDYNDQVPDVSWEYDPSYRANSREESDTSISAEDNSIEIGQDEISTKEDKRNIDSDSLRFVRSTKANLDNLLKKEEDAVADLKKYVKRDEDLMMIDYVAEKMIDDINERHGPRRKKRQIVADQREFQRLLTDPNTKLDMTKTLENVGTVARSAIEHQRAPLYHFRNAVGSVRDAVVATMKIPNQNFIIPAQYEIVSQQDAPLLASRFGGDDKCSDDPVTDTFQKVGSVVRSTIKSGQEAIGHIGQAANHARTAIQTTHQSTPRLRLSKIPARVQTPRLSSRMGGDETVGEPEPKNFVNLGRIMDAVGISNPDSTVGSESIVFVPRSRMAAMRNRFRTPQPQPPKRNQQDPVVGAAIKNLREAQQTVGADSLGDLLKRMRDGLQGFVKHDILGIQDDDEVQKVQEKKGNKQPIIGSRSSIPSTEVQPKQSKKSTNPRKSSNVTQSEMSGQDDIVGSGLPLAPELLHPFMNRATSDQEKKFLDMFNTNSRNQRSNDEHLGDVLGAINPVMFQRVFQEKLKTENSTTDENTPHDVFHHHHDGHSHGAHEVTDQDQYAKSENVSTSMKIQGPFLKPFMGQPSKKNKEVFFSQFQRSSNDQSKENPEKREGEDASAMQSVEGNDLQDAL